MNYHPDLPLTGFKTREWVKLRYAISNSTLHQWQTDGRFPKSVKIGPRAVRFLATDLAAFEAAMTIDRDTLRVLSNDAT